MGEKKVTIMVLKVDLQCEKCYEKVKKVLCKFPQIRDQMYDEKNNQVIIKVVCCSPEKIRDKLCCKGDGAIKSIDIKEPEKPKPKPKPEKLVADKPKEKLEPEKPKQKPEPEKPKEKPEPDEKKPEKLTPDAPPFPAYPPVTVNVCCILCYGGHPGCPCQTRFGYGGAEKPKEKPEAENPKPTPPPVIPDPPVSACCMECYEGHPGGPCQTGYGYGGPAPSIQYDGYCGRTVYDSYGGGRSYATSSCCMTSPDCFSEENPQACAIM